MLRINSQYHDTTRVIRSVSKKTNLNWRNNFKHVFIRFVPKGAEEFQF